MFRRENNIFKRAFTLIELVVVIAVIAILAGVSVAAYFGVTESAKKSAALQEGEQLKTLVTVVANTDDGKVKVGETTYDLDLTTAGLSVKNGDAAVTEDTKLDQVFDAIYFIGTTGEYDSNTDKRFVDNTYATLECIVDSELVTSFNYTLNGATQTIKLTA